MCGNVSRVPSVEIAASSADTGAGSIAAGLVNHEGVDEYRAGTTMLVVSPKRCLCPTPRLSSRCDTSYVTLVTGVMRVTLVTEVGNLLYAPE